MLYYGDRARDVAPRDVARRIAAVLHRAGGIEGDARDEALVTALVEAGQLAQGIADGVFQARGHDDPDPASDAAQALTDAIGRWLWASWSCARACPAAADAGRRPASDAAAGDVAVQLANRLASMHLPPSVSVKVPEGYAHYALHPAAYAAAASALAAGACPVVVVGIRSIGTSLAAMVAAAAGARDVLTLRPTGAPYRRAIAAGPRVRRRVAELAACGATFAVVDEGPGLSGSSFDAVTAWLRAAGVEAGRIVAFPSHDGAPGPAAPAERRERWSRTAKRIASFEEVVLPRLRAATERALGTADLEDISGGRWRTLVAATPARRPIFAQQERRKYLLRSTRAHGPVLLRFAGIGPYGEETFARAVALGEAGFAPPAMALLHGFVAQRWIVPNGGAARFSRPTLDRVGAYVGARARTFPAGPRDGAAPERLLEMLRVNASEALGPAVAAGVARLEGGARDVERLQPIAVDGKMEPWEWLAVADGTVLKGDAVDHAFGHDLVGCQPAAWDVAGARVELGIGWEDAVLLAARVSPGATAPALAFLEAAYLAHRIGRWTFARQLEGDPAERQAIATALQRYTTLLLRRLDSAATR